ncbi:unnamed protein product [Victoria cruziana]
MVGWSDSPLLEEPLAHSRELKLERFAGTGAWNAANLLLGISHLVEFHDQDIEILQLDEQCNRRTWFKDFVGLAVDV